MLEQINATVTNSAAVVQDKNTGKKLPGEGSYLQIHNPNSSASIAYTFDGSTPIVNGNGFTLGPLGTATFDNPGGATWSGVLTAISSTASQSATILYGTP